MLKDKIVQAYKQNLFNRCDDNGAIYYFSDKDFENIKKKEYNFLSSKGYNLKGNLYFYDNYKTNILVIFEHGMGGGHLSYFKEIELLARHGYLVLGYDHSGCMESGGENTSGFAQSLCDLNDCINSLKKHDEFKNYDYYVIGHSWGAFSTMNIPYFHNDIKKIVALSGFVSVENILKQTFSGLLKCAYNDILNIEKQSNPNFVNANACESLKNYNGKALLIYSKDDRVVNYKYHYNYLYNNLKLKNNIKLLLVNNKNHNPNYTEEAVKYKDKFFKIYTKTLKQGKLNTLIQKEQFKQSFDWNKMTNQDQNIWNQIFEVFDNE